MDPFYNRVTYKGQQDITNNGSISTKLQCEDYEVDFVPNMKLIYQRIRIEMHYEMKNTISKATEFCKTCVAVNPADPKEVVAMVGPDIACQDLKCHTNLKVTSSLPSSYKFQRGSNIKLSIPFKISNSGEDSYVTQLNVKLTGIEFSRTPPNCASIGNLTMQCDLKNEGPLRKTDALEQIIELNVLKAGESFNVAAHAASVNQELPNSNNSLIMEVKMVDFSRVHVHG